jgi:ribosome-associated translation inhibitor RaiA
MMRKQWVKLRHLVGVAIDWRVRDYLEAERSATVQLGNTFVEASVELTDKYQNLEKVVAKLEKRIADLENGTK